LVLHCAVFETPADHILEAVELVKDRKSSGPCFRRASVKRLRSEKRLNEARSLAAKREREARALAEKERRRTEERGLRGAPVIISF
jgi:hypothetical protein